MKHRHGNRILGRVAARRTELLRSLSAALLTHGSIVTQEAKAKELRKFFEPMVTYAKQDLTLHRRRQLLRKLPKDSLPKLITVAQEMKNRPGGYLRVTRIPTRRQDASVMARVEIVK